MSIPSAATSPVVEFADSDSPVWGRYPATVADIDEVVAFDTETTGTTFEDDRIVTVHVSTVARGGVVADPFDVIVDAGVEISDAAAAVHGVTNERRVAEGIAEADAAAQIAKRLERAIEHGVPIVAFNAVFDVTMLSRALARHGLAPLRLHEAVILDPFVLDKAIDTYRRGKRQLTHVAAHYGVAFDGAHEADADAAAAARLLFAMTDRHRAGLGVMRLADVGRTQQRLFRGQATSLEAHFRRQGTLAAPLNKNWPLAGDQEPGA